MASYCSDDSDSVSGESQEEELCSNEVFSLRSFGSSETHGPSTSKHESQECFAQYHRPNGQSQYYCGTIEEESGEYDTDDKVSKLCE